MKFALVLASLFFAYAHAAPEKSVTLIGSQTIEQAAVGFLLELENGNDEVKPVFEGIDESIRDMWEGQASLCSRKDCFQVLKTAETVEVEQSSATVRRVVEISVFQSAHNKAPFADDYWTAAVARFYYTGSRTLGKTSPELGTLKFLDLKEID